MTNNFGAAYGVNEADDAHGKTGHIMYHVHI